jgi:hypothetical protein
MQISSLVAIIIYDTMMVTATVALDLFQICKHKST